MSIRPVLLVLAAAALACAPPAGTSSSGRDPNVISRQELEASVAVNAYDAIMNLRPTFLRSRGTNTFDAAATTLPDVYVDGQRFGNITNLKSMTLDDSSASCYTADNIAEIRLLRASDATNKYGTNHTTGVIEVTTRK